ncbi:hypothetical protein B0H13DRAFT_2333000 [Mycena leptocephala]|nr:hypothetical protein B0H13DRAFT_2333000 [Mycena leptocephala]
MRAVKAAMSAVCDPASIWKKWRSLPVPRVVDNTGCCDHILTHCVSLPTRARGPRRAACARRGGLPCQQARNVDAEEHSPPSAVYTSKRSLRMHGGGEVGSVRVVSEDLEPVVVAGYRSSDATTSSGRHSECAALALGMVVVRACQCRSEFSSASPVPADRALPAHKLAEAIALAFPQQLVNRGHLPAPQQPCSTHAHRTLRTGMARESARNPASMERGRSSDDGGRSFGAKNGCRVDAEMDEESRATRNDDTRT